jgi:NADP-dependent 3-hydroxy acid dehydrogenase YdfG
LQIGGTVPRPHEAYHGGMAAAQPVAVVTGASSGIGEATARVLAGAGFLVVVGARRLDRLKALEGALGAVALPLDVREQESIDRFAGEVGARLGSISVLVNNAGLAAGLEPVSEGDDANWRAMLDTNVLGLLRMTRACLPLLRKAERAHIVNLGSVAGFEVYAGGAGYTASKHAVRAISRTLRIELSGEPIRITEIDPGMVETEFSLVRFKGDAERAGAVYQGVKPLTGADVAEAIGWAVTRPPHVNVDELVLRPVQQANAFTVHRGPLRHR